MLPQRSAPSSWLQVFLGFFLQTFYIFLIPSPAEEVAGGDSVSSHSDTRAMQRTLVGAVKGFQRVKRFEMQFPLPSSPPPGLNKYPPAGRCLPHPAGFCSQAFVWGWERGQDPSASPGTHIQTRSCLLGMLRGRQEVGAACARCHRAWGHPMSHPGVP